MDTEESRGAGLSPRRLVGRGARALFFPIRRLLDPRFAGLAQQADTIHLDIQKRLDEVKEATLDVSSRVAEITPNEAALLDLTRLLQANLEATSEATVIAGSAVSATDLEGLKNLFEKLRLESFDSTKPFTWENALAEIGRGLDRATR